MVSEPKPLAPGEKALVTIDRAAKRSTLHPHDEMLRIVRERWLRAHRRRGRRPL